MENDRDNNDARDQHTHASGPENHKDHFHTKQEAIQEGLPGYPHYPASEDILNPSNEMERVDVDVENIARSGKVDDPAQRPATATSNNIDLPEQEDLEDLEGEIDLGSKTASDADITKEDLLILRAIDQDMDMGNDENLKVSQTGEDLDVPGEELDDADEELGEEDEENNYYSLGGDNHENLEENSG